MGRSSASRGIRLRAPRRGPVGRVLDAIGNVWFGVGLLVVTFLYSSLGSAIPPIRQGALADVFGIEALRFEMTEMQWFCSPVFVGLILLFSLSIVTVTLRRIPFDLPRLGVWTVHAGILVLVCGCLLYFGRKVEGTAVLYERSAMVRAAGMDAPAKLVVKPGSEVAFGEAPHRYRVSVSRMQPRYEILSGDHKGERTTSIWFDVQRLDATEYPRFMRVVLVGYPQYTEDVVVGTPNGPQRARKMLGRPLIDDSLDISLAYEPQDSFYVTHTASLYVRRSPSEGWSQLPLKHMPRYYEHVSDPADVRTAAGAVMPARPIAVRPKRADDDGFSDVSFTVVGYLPYAVLDSHWADGGTELNPVVQFSLPDGKSRQSYELVAFDEDRSHMFFEEARMLMEFRWARSPEERAELGRQYEPKLAFGVPGHAEPIVLTLSSLIEGGSQPVGDTDYVVMVTPDGVLPHFPLLGGARRGQRDHAVLVSVKHGDASFQRIVFANFTDQNCDLDAGNMPKAEMSEPDFVIRYLDPAPAGLRLVAGPTTDTCDVIFNEPDGQQVRQTAAVGEQAALQENGAHLRIDALYSHAQQHEKPFIVPRERRQSLQDVGATMSMVEVDVRRGDERQRVWLPFNSFVFPSEQYAYPERFRYGSYSPATVTFADGESIELLYAPQRRALPAPVTLEQFVLETDPGGQKERDFISRVRFQEAGGWSEPYEIRSNQPGEYGGLWFFQAQWDPTNEALTILGVGNRQGIGIMLAGVIMTIAGMIYAYYVKPLILRRRSRRTTLTLRATAPVESAVAEAQAQAEVREEVHA